jgi:hypothetical protein
MKKEIEYWKIQYQWRKELYNEAKSILEADPTNPWQRTRVANLETAYLEANDRYFSLLEEER